MFYASHQFAMNYRAANDDKTSLQAGESDVACDARHCTIRPPPGGTPPHSVRTSPPHADLKTNSSSRGRIGRSAMVAGAAAGAAPGLAAAAPPAAGVVSPPVAALTACWQLDDSFDLLVSRQFSAAAPPVGTLAQVFW
jgi:hypothetical protein